MLGVTVRLQYVMARERTRLFASRSPGADLWMIPTIFELYVVLHRLTIGWLTIYCHSHE